MRKRLGKFAIIVLAFSFVMVGCSKKESVNPNGEEVAQEDMTQEETVYLTVWGSANDQELLNEIAENFKKEYANQATFEITVQPQEESVCKANLLVDVHAGADVFTFPDDQLMSLVAGGVLEPIKEVQAIKEANSESSIAASSIQGELYAYPLTADNGYFMYYNKAYFTDEDVKSFNRMLEVAVAADKKVIMDMTSGWYLFSFFGNTGLEVGLNGDGITNYCTWNSTEGKIKGTDVAEAILSIASNPGFLCNSIEGMPQGIQDGTVIAAVSGVWNATMLEDAWRNNYGAVKLPTYEVAGQDIQMASFAGYKMIGVNSYSYYKEWATKLAEYISNEENQTLRFVQRGQGPTNNNAAASEAVKNSPAIQAILAQSAYATLQQIGDNYWGAAMNLGSVMANKNSEHLILQELLDTTVEGITSQKNN